MDGGLGPLADPCGLAIRIEFLAIRSGSSADVTDRSGPEAAGSGDIYVNRRVSLRRPSGQVGSGGMQILPNCRVRHRKLTVRRSAHQMAGHLGGSATSRSSDELRLLEPGRGCSTASSCRPCCASVGGPQVIVLKLPKRFARASAMMNSSRSVKDIAVSIPGIFIAVPVVN